MSDNIKNFILPESPESPELLKSPKILNVIDGFNLIAGSYNNAIACISLDIVIEYANEIDKVLTDYIKCAGDKHKDTIETVKILRKYFIQGYPTENEYLEEAEKLKKVYGILGFNCDLLPLIKFLPMKKRVEIEKKINELNIELNMNLNIELKNKLYYVVRANGNDITDPKKTMLTFNKNMKNYINSFGGNHNTAIIISEIRGKTSADSADFPSRDEILNNIKNTFGDHLKYYIVNGQTTGTDLDFYNVFAAPEEWKCSQLEYVEADDIKFYNGGTRRMSFFHSPVLKCTFVVFHSGTDMQVKTRIFALKHAMKRTENLEGQFIIAGDWNIFKEFAKEFVKKVDEMGLKCNYNIRGDEVYTFDDKGNEIKGEWYGWPCDGILHNELIVNPNAHQIPSPLIVVISNGHIVAVFQQRIPEMTTIIGSVDYGSDHTIVKVTFGVPS